MLQYHTAKQKFAILFLMLIFAGITGHTQQVAPIAIGQPQPVWWFGVSGAANFNYYRGTTQMLNQSLTVPTAFHKGHGVKPYVSLLTEYRPNKVWGGMLNVALDNRGGKFDGVIAPCNCPATLSTNISYLTIEPSLRLAPFASAFYVFAGPSLSFNVSKAFTYTQDKQPDTRSDWSDIHNTVFSAQAGAGIDIPVSARTSATQMTFSPFASFQTDFGHEPRSEESWSFYTVRVGIALKFGTAQKSTTATTITEPVTTTSTTMVTIGSWQTNPASLPVIQTDIPANVVTNLKNKYGANLYDITKIKSTSGQDIYIVKVLDNDQVRMDYVDENGNTVSR
ncbi:MAG TPA: outer membrane beta-barrel protein [Chitinophagaceae bacterium]